MHLTSAQLAELALLLVVDKAESDLDDETDAEAALRKAVLVLAALSQNSDDPATQKFLRYVLTQFRPLLSQLNDSNDLRVWDGHSIGLRASADGKPVVTIDRAIIDAVLQEFANKDIETKRKVLARLTKRPSEVRHWSRTADRFVGFFDVMGFSARVREAGADHGGIYSLMRALHDAVRKAEKLRAQGDERTQVLSIPAASAGQLQALQFSDSIVAITEDASPASSVLIQMASHLLFVDALMQGVILRGAIARGTITADFSHSIFFGRPIEDAYRLEQAQQWYGIAVHASARDADLDDVPEIEEDDTPILEEYGVHLKGQDAPVNLPVINWPVFANDLETLTTLLQPFDGKGSPEQEKLSHYHRRTLGFAQTIWRKYRA